VPVQTSQNPQDQCGDAFWIVRSIRLNESISPLGDEDNFNFHGLKSENMNSYQMQVRYQAAPLAQDHQRIVVLDRHLGFGGLRLIPNGNSQFFYSLCGLRPVL